MNEPAELSDAVNCDAIERQSRSLPRQLIHDLRTPLSIISMGIDILATRFHNDEDAVELLRMMKQDGLEKAKAILEEREREQIG